MKNTTYLCRLCKVVLFLPFLLSCENEIPFKVSENQPKLIVNALINANKTENEIRLALTGNKSTSPVTDGEINIYINDKPAETIRPVVVENNFRKEVRYISYLQYSEGDQVRLEVSTADGLHLTKTELTIPHSIRIEKIDTATVSIYNRGEYLRIRTTFTDNPSTKDFYRIAVSKELTYHGLSNVTGRDTVVIELISSNLLIREDVVLTEGKPGTTEDTDDSPIPVYENIYAIFDDSRLSGSYTMTTSLPFYGYYGYHQDFKAERISMDVVVRLISLTEAEYYYLRALNVYDSIDYDEMLSPPVRFPTNVTGGTGIVGVSVESSQKFNLFKDMENPYL